MFNADDFLVECMSIALTCDQNDETVPKISSTKCHHDDIRGVFSMSFQYSKFMIRRVIRESLRIEIVMGDLDFDWVIDQAKIFVIVKTVFNTLTF